MVADVPVATVAATTAEVAVPLAAPRAARHRVVDRDAQEAESDADRDRQRESGDLSECKSFRIKVYNQVKNNFFIKFN